MLLESVATVRYSASKFFEIIQLWGTSHCLSFEEHACGYYFTKSWIWYQKNELNSCCEWMILPPQPTMRANIPIITKARLIRWSICDGKIQIACHAPVTVDWVPIKSVHQWKNIHSLLSCFFPHATLSHNDQTVTKQCKLNFYNQLNENIRYPNCIFSGNKTSVRRRKLWGV